MVTRKLSIVLVLMACVTLNFAAHASERKNPEMSDLRLPGRTSGVYSRKLPPMIAHHSISALNVRRKKTAAVAQSPQDEVGQVFNYACFEQEMVQAPVLLTRQSNFDGEQFPDRLEQTRKDFFSKRKATLESSNEKKVTLLGRHPELMFKFFEKQSSDKLKKKFKALSFAQQEQIFNKYILDSGEATGAGLCYFLSKDQNLLFWLVNDFYTDLYNGKKKIISLPSIAKKHGIAIELLRTVLHSHVESEGASDFDPMYLGTFSPERHTTCGKIFNDLNAVIEEDLQQDIQSNKSCCVVQ